MLFKIYDITYIIYIYIQYLYPRIRGQLPSKNKMRTEKRIYYKLKFLKVWLPLVFLKTKDSRRDYKFYIEVNELSREQQECMEK